jgi:hypothetical protein
MGFFDIGFGLVLYRILMWLLYPLAILIVLPFFVNLFNGRGYGHNFKVIWGGFFHFISFGLRKRD